MVLNLFSNTYLLAVHSSSRKLRCEAAKLYMKLLLFDFVIVNYYTPKRVLLTVKKLNFYISCSV